jgi:hypothetical protein
MFIPLFFCKGKWELEVGENLLLSQVGQDLELIENQNNPFLVRTDSNDAFIVFIFSFSFSSLLFLFFTPFPFLHSFPFFSLLSLSLSLSLSSPLSQFRVRNLPYAKDVYMITVDHSTQQVVVRTTNKKYFKRISITDMKRFHIPLDEVAF